MSIVFEGVIFICDLEKLREECADFVREHGTSEYAFEQIDADLSVVYGVGPERRFYDEFVSLAEQLSMPMEKPCSSDMTIATTPTLPIVTRTER